MFFVASGTASVFEAAAMRGRRCASPRISEIAEANRSGVSSLSVMTTAPPARSTTRAFSS